MNRIYGLLVVLLMLTSCNEYQKAIKSKENTQKYDVAIKMYEQQKYTKAIVLFESIGSSYRTKPEGEKMYFMFADSYYQKKQYLLAGYQFEAYVSSFPKSTRVEEAAFLSSKCYFKESAKYSLDQKDTYKAIDKLQKFINTYIESLYLPEANIMMKSLTEKLEKKSFEIAKQYNIISDYKAAIKALDIFMSENPGSVYREESLFLKFDSGCKLALNSVVSKKEDRLRSAKSYYNALIKFNPTTTYKEKADEMLVLINKELTQITQ